MKRFTQFVTCYRWSCIAFVAVIVGLCSLGLPSLYYDSSTNSFLIENDKVLVRYKQFLEKFETDEYTVMLLDAPAVWTNEYIQLIRKLKNEVEVLPGIKKVTSIVNVEHIQNIDGELQVEEFFPAKDLDPDAIKQKVDYALTNKIYRNVLINKDATKITLIIESKEILGETHYKSELVHAIVKINEQPEYQSLHAKIAGAPIIETFLQEISIRESLTFGVIVFFVLLAGLYMVFRSALGVILPVSIGALAVCSTFGLMGLMGMPLGIMTPMVPTFLLSVGMTSCLYLLTQIYGNVAQGMTLTAALDEAMSHSALTCLLSALTTAGALLMFSFSDIKLLMELGIAMGIGLLLSILYTLLLVPAVFSFVKNVKISEKRNQIILGRVNALEHISRFVSANNRNIIVVFAVIAVFAVYGLSLIRLDFSYLSMFKPSSQVHQANTEIDREFGNSNSIEIQITSKADGGIKEPEVMKFIEQVATAAENYPDFAVKSYSVVDIVKDINQVFNDGQKEYYRLPESRDSIAQFLLLFEMGGGKELKRLVADDFKTARITLYIPNLMSQQNKKFVAYLHDSIDTATAASNSPLVKGLSVEITGLVMLWVTINGYLLDSQVQSMLLAMALVSVVMIAITRSFKLGIVMTLSNVFVVVLVLGCMGWMGITLDHYTILIGTIALGILDDDTIHFVKQFQNEYARVGCPHTAVRNTFRASGQAIFYTTSIICIASLIYTLSDMNSLIHFGLLSALTVGLGMLIEFFLTPSILLWLYQGGESADEFLSLSSEAADS